MLYQRKMYTSQNIILCYIDMLIFLNSFFNGLPSSREAASEARGGERGAPRRGGGGRDRAARDARGAWRRERRVSMNSKVVQISYIIIMHTFQEFSTDPN